MTPEQIEWARQQFWFDRSGEDADGMFVVGWDSWGSRNALLFRDFGELEEWASMQREISDEMVVEPDVPEMTAQALRRAFVLCLVFGLGAFVPIWYLVWGPDLSFVARLFGLLGAMGGFGFILRAWVLASQWRLKVAGTPAWWSIDKGPQAT
ncbi:hypothetical protein [Pseudomonas sp. NPDC089569]|uniref:hypothetical protein n=1 Tax=Pseudomonas sp. NPDC089569 TaxID=3390722 RepID=UPI003D063C46